MEEIAVNDVFRMVLQKRTPVLRWWLSVLDHVRRHRRLRDLDAQFEPLTVYSWCPPEGVSQRDPSNQAPNVPGYLRGGRPLRFLRDFPVQ